MRFVSPFPSLVLKLALFYLGLALLAALIVRGTVLAGELGALDRDLRRGWLAEGAAQAAARFPAGADRLPERAALRAYLTSVLTSLKAPRDRDDDRAEILSELSDPLGAAVLDPSGRPVAERGAKLDWAGAPAPGAAAAAGLAVLRLPTPAGPDAAWRYLAPLKARSGATVGLLAVEFRRRPPGWRALTGDSFEAPAVLIYVLVFGLGSAVFLSALVTRRLRRIATAAGAWSRGDFGASIDDRSGDEIGRLGRSLDAMARELETLVTLRARLASLGERQRFARDLHDTVKQKAFALQLQLAAIRPGKAAGTDLAGRIEEARGITAEIQRELADLIETAPAGSDAPFPLELALRAETWGRRGGFVVETDLAAAVAAPDDQRPILTRILDEALANVMRHSGATRARVVFALSAHGFELSVSDNGRGLRGAEDGRGLRNMKQRAAELPRGRLSLTDAAPGARLALSWARIEGDPA